MPTQMLSVQYNSLYNLRSASNRHLVESWPTLRPIKSLPVGSTTRAETAQNDRCGSRNSRWSHCTNDELIRTPGGCRCEGVEGRSQCCGQLEKLCQLFARNALRNRSAHEKSEHRLSQSVCRSQEEKKWNSRNSFSRHILRCFRARAESNDYRAVLGTAVVWLTNESNRGHWNKIVRIVLCLVGVELDVEVCKFSRGFLILVLLRTQEVVTALVD